MNILSDEQAALRDAVHEFLVKFASSTQVRRDMEQPEGFDPSIWTLFAEQLGICGLGVAEGLGGAGGDFTDVAIVLEQFGRCLSGLPFLSSVVLAPAALTISGDSEAIAEFMPAMASGQLRATVAFQAQHSGWDPDSANALGVRARLADGGWALDGAADFVLDGASADLVFVIANAAQGPSLFAATAKAPGLDRRTLPTMDQTRRLARLEFADVPARLIGAPGAAAPVLERVFQTAAVALALDATAGAERALAITVDYAKLREQFGRPIGSFQAVKHRCADMFVAVEAARAIAYEAVAVLSAESSATSGTDVRRTASLAKAFCTAAYEQVTRDMIQIHGGIGFTWEHDAHLYLKRALADAALFGSVAEHRRRVSHALGLLPTAEAKVLSL